MLSKRGLLPSLLSTQYQYIFFFEKPLAIPTSFTQPVVLPLVYLLRHYSIYTLTSTYGPYPACLHRGLLHERARERERERERERKLSTATTPRSSPAATCALFPAAQAGAGSEADHSCVMPGRVNSCFIYIYIYLSI
jgi:hypothetical protein